MRIQTCRAGEELTIGEVRLLVLSVQRGKVRLGIKAASEDSDGLHPRQAEHLIEVVEGQPRVTVRRSVAKRNRSGVQGQNYRRR